MARKLKAQKSSISSRIQAATEVVSPQVTSGLQKDPRVHVDVVSLSKDHVKDVWKMLCIICVTCFAS